MSNKHQKHQSIQRFVKANYGLLATQSDFDKKAYKDARQAYFGDKLAYKYGMPKDKNIAKVLVEVSIKTNGIESVDELAKWTSKFPFVEMAGVDANDFLPAIEYDRQRKEDSRKTKGMDEGEKLEYVKRQVIKEKTQEIEENARKREKELKDAIFAKEAELARKEEQYKRLPSILDDTEFDEPDQEEDLKEQQIIPWWQELNLKGDPFPGPLEGFCGIDKSLYDEIAIQTKPIKWMLEKLRAGRPEIFHRGHLVSGDFGTGKTTFFDVLAPHLVIAKIEPILLPMSPNISVSHYIQAFQKRLSIEMAKLAKIHGLKPSSRIIDFEEAQIFMMDLQETKSIRGFVIFIDDLHKHSNHEEVFSFLANLQMTKSTLARENINAAFFVAGLPHWADRVRQDSALTGFFDAPDMLSMPVVTPKLAAHAIAKRLEAFVVNPNKKLEVSEDFLEVVFKRASANRGGGNIGYRPYIQEAIATLKARKFDILSIGSPVIHQNTIAEIREALEMNAVFKKSIDQLVYGGGIEKAHVRTKTLNILCEVNLRHGITEDDSLFEKNTFCFKRLAMAGFIQKADRGGVLHWQVAPFFDKINKEIIESYDLSMEDYLVPVYSESPRKQRTSDITKLGKYQADLREWRHTLDNQITSGLTKALGLYEEHLHPLLNTQKNITGLKPKHAGLFRDCICTLMRTIVRFESPSLLDLLGGEDLDGWALRHRPLEGPESFVKSAKLSSGLSARPADIARLVPLADEAFEELWNEFGVSATIFTDANLKCYQICPDLISCIYRQHGNLFSFGIVGDEFFSSLDHFVSTIEQFLRCYLHVSCMLLFGPYHERRHQYPADIMKYICNNAPSGATSYEGYNEFENLNRGQYRVLFTQQKKSSMFYRKIVDPIISSWDTRDITAFFNLFGNLDIIRGHVKKGGVDEIKKDVPTFFRLACRMAANMSSRLADLVLSEHTVVTDSNGTPVSVIYGHRPDTSEGLSRTCPAEDAAAISGDLFRHDIFSLLAGGMREQILRNSHNHRGDLEIDLTGVDNMSIQYSIGFCSLIPLVSFLTASQDLQGIVLYGTRIYLKKTPRE